MKKKVIFFTASGCGGAERQAIIISKCLKDSEFNVIYHTFGPRNEIQNFIPTNRETTFHCEPKFTHYLIKHMRSIIKKEKPDIVYGAMMPINWRLVIASSFKGCKVILRNEYYVEKQSFFQKLRLACTYPFADYIISQTDEMTKGLIDELNLKEGLVHTMANAIDKDYIGKCIQENSPYHSDEAKVKFIASGRFKPVKGFDLLTKAFVLVKHEIPNSELYILGSYTEGNEMYKQIVNIAKENNILDCVHCVGFQSNPYKFVKDADCFVLSSRGEGLPNVLIEALYLGTPVAAFKCIPVIERIVCNNKNGYLAEKEDVSSLANAMISASKLGRIKSTYKQNTEESFAQIFKNM